jgi:hypothetical protein
MGILAGADFVKSRLGLAVAAMLCVGVVSSRAGTIGPGDFGPNAVTETFDQLQAGSGFSPPLVLNGVSYFFSGGGAVIAYNPLSYFCVSGNCIATTATNAVMTIALDNPAERVGGYLGGAFSLPEATFYDANPYCWVHLTHSRLYLLTAETPPFLVSRATTMTSSIFR